MREVKFRAWDKYRNRLINDVLTVRFHRITNDPCLVVYTDKKIKNNSEIKESDKEYCNEFNLMQYTGLKDKNGKEIYEGDLVAVADYANWEGLYKIIWDEKNLMYMLEDAFGDREKLCEFEEYLVKGNIYENPELLEG